MDISQIRRVEDENARGHAGAQTRAETVVQRPVCELVPAGKELRLVVRATSDIQLTVTLIKDLRAVKVTRQHVTGS